MSKPFGDNAPYDFIVDFDGKLSKVQVKSTGCIDSGSYRITTSHLGSGKVLYTADEVDFIIGYVIPEAAWYIIPIDKITSRHTKLFPHNLNSKGRFEPYREAWSLLR